MLTRTQESTVVRELKNDPLNADDLEKLAITFCHTAKQMFEVVVPIEEARVAVARAFPPRG